MPSSNALDQNKLSMNDQEWSWFSFDDIFSIKGTKTISLLKLEKYGKGVYPYVTTQTVNNGVKEYFDCYTEEGNVFVIDSAVLGYCSYQEQGFSASDHVEKLMLKDKKLNKYIALFIVTICNLEQYRYSYGRKRCHARIKKEKINYP